MNYFLNILFHFLTFMRATEQVKNNILCPKNDYIDKLRNNFLQRYIDFVQSRIKNLHESIKNVSSDNALIAKLKSKNIETYNDLKFFIFNDNGCGYFYSYFLCFIVVEWYDLFKNIGIKILNPEEQENLLQNITLSKFQQFLSCFDALFCSKLKEKYKNVIEKDENRRFWYIYSLNNFRLDEKIQKENTMNENKPVVKIFYDPLDIHNFFMINTAIEKTFLNAIPNDKKFQIVLFTFDVSTFLYQFLRNLEETKKVIDVIDIKKFLVDIINTLQGLDKNKIEAIMKLRKFCKEHNIIILFDRFNIYEYKSLLNFTLFNYLGLDEKETDIKETFRLAMEQIDRYTSEIKHGMFSKSDLLDYPNQFENLTEFQKIEISSSTFGYLKENRLYLKPLQEKKAIFLFQIHEANIFEREKSKYKMQSRKKEVECDIEKA